METKLKRAKKGSLGDKPLVLRMPDELRAHAQREARRDGVTLTEWIRQAIAERLLRAEARRRGML